MFARYNSWLTLLPCILLISKAHRMTKHLGDNSFLVLYNQERALIELTPLYPISFDTWLDCKRWFVHSELHLKELSYGADLLEVTIQFQHENFTLYYEANCESCWIKCCERVNIKIISCLIDVLGQLAFREK